MQQYQIITSVETAKFNWKLEAAMIIVKFSYQPKVMYLLQGSCCSNKWISIVEMMTTCCQAKCKNSGSWFFFFKGQKHGHLNKDGAILQRVGRIDVSSATVVGLLRFFF